MYHNIEVINDINIDFIFIVVTIIQSPAQNTAGILVLNSNSDSYFFPECAEQAQNWFWRSLKIKSPQHANLGKLFRNAVVWLIYIFIIASRYLIKVKLWHFKYFIPTRCGVDPCYSGETNITLNGSTSQLLLSYKLFICTYQVYMHRIPRIYFCDVLGWKMSINSLSIFGLLIYISQISIQLCLHCNSFPVAHLPDYFCIPLGWLR